MDEMNKEKLIKFIELLLEALIIMPGCVILFFFLPVMGGAFFLQLFVNTRNILFICLVVVCFSPFLYILYRNEGTGWGGV